MQNKFEAVLTKIIFRMNAQPVGHNSLQHGVANDTQKAFHRKLANFSSNALLAFVVSFMGRILTDLTVYRRLYDPPNRELYDKGLAYQTDLIAALRNGNAEDARAIMRAHMETAEDLMQAQEAQVLRRFIEE